MVFEHLPTVIASQECRKENTATIRVLIQQACSGSQKIIGEKELIGARVWTWMVSERLEQVMASDNLEQAQNLQPRDFLRVYFDSMRCMSVTHSQKCDVLTRR